MAEVLRAPGAGEPLLPSVRERVRQGLGIDPTPVRVHADPRARAAAAALGARAFAHGTDVFLGPGESPADVALLSHEVVHVVQQQGSPAVALFDDAHAHDGLEREARSAGATVAAGGAVAVQGRTSPGQIQRQGRLARAWGAVTSTVSEVAEAGAEWVEEQAWGLVERFAPELAPILRQGIRAWLEERVLGAVERFFDNLLRPIRTVGEFIDTLVAHFTRLGGWARDAAAGLARGDCSAITQAAERIQQVVEGLAAPIIDRIKHLADRVKGFLSDLWDRFGAPVWNFLREAGGVVWERLQRFGAWLWEVTAPIRDQLSRAWAWIKRKLGIGDGPDDQNGLLQWVQRKAGEVWDWLSARLAPYKRQLLAVAGVLVMLSPAGPVIALGAGIAGLIMGIRWLARNLRNPREAVVDQRGFLERTVIPGINNAVGAVSAALTRAAGWLTEKLETVVGHVSGAVSAVAGSILRFAVGIAQWVLDRFRALAVWAARQVAGLADVVGSVLVRVRTLLEPLLNVLRWFGRVIANVLEVVGLVAQRAWNLIPACIRDPIVGFISQHILRRIPLFAALLDIPNVWSRIRDLVRTVIAGVFRGGSLVEAVLQVFRFFLEVMRIPWELVTGIFTKASTALDLIMANPGGFLRNVLGALKQGLAGFFRNIVRHLFGGIAGWLFGQLAQAGITVPSDFTPGSIFRLVMQILGITVERVLELLGRKIGRPAADRLRRALNFLSGAWEFLKVLMERGVTGLWEYVRGQLSNLWTTILNAVVGYLEGVIFVRAAERLLRLLDPTGIMAVITAIQTVWSTIQTAMEYLRQILEIIDRFFDMLGNIARGVLGTAADLLERLLAGAIPIAIGWLANWLGIGNLGARVREAIETLQQRVTTAIEGLIDRALAAGRALLTMITGGAAAQAPGAQPVDERLPEEDFDEEDGEEHHHISWQEEAGHRVLVMSSGTATKIRVILRDARARLANLSAAEVRRREPVINDAVTKLDEVERLEDKLERRSTTGDERVNARRDLVAAEGALAGLIKRVIRGTALRRGRNRFRLEGMVGSYSQMDAIAGTGDKFEADHQPAASVVLEAADVRYDDGKPLFAPSSALQSIYAAGSHCSGAITIVISEIRHKLGRTYGNKAKTVSPAARAEMDNERRSHPGDRAAQRAAVLRVLSREANRDARAMETVIEAPYTDKSVWQDIWDLNLKGGEPETQTLVGEVRGTIRDGEGSIRRQDLSSIG